MGSAQSNHRPGGDSSPAASGHMEGGGRQPGLSPPPTKKEGGLNWPHRMGEWLGPVGGPGPVGGRDFDLAPWMKRGYWPRPMTPAQGKGGVSWPHRQEEWEWPCSRSGEKGTWLCPNGKKGCNLAPTQFCKRRGRGLAPTQPCKRKGAWLGSHQVCEAWGFDRGEGGCINAYWSHADKCLEPWGGPWAWSDGSVSSTGPQAEGWAPLKQRDPTKAFSVMLVYVMMDLQA